MAEIYSSTSGNYINYLEQRQTDKIKDVIKHASTEQNAVTMAGTRELSNKIHKMQTGIQTSINENTYAVVASSAILNETFRQGFDSVNNTLDLGFAGVSSAIGTMGASMTAGFSNLASSINNLAETICDRLDQIHNAVNNPLVTASRELYRLGIKNAENQFYKEALENITAAIEKNKTDYISWGTLGKLYLFGMSDFSNVVDIPKAAEAFTNACKYITPDINDSSDAKALASEYYFYLGYANYILSNEARLENNANAVSTYLEASAAANKKSYVLSDNMLESLYNQARAFSLLGQKDNAIACLEEIIRKDNLYSIKVMGDADFTAMQSDVVALIEKLRDELYAKLQEMIRIVHEEYCIFNGEFANELTTKLNVAKSINAASPYLDVNKVFMDLNPLMNKLNSGDIPYDNTLCSVSFKPNENKNDAYHSEVYKNMLILCKKNFHTIIRCSSNTDINYMQEYGFSGIKIPDSVEERDDSFWGYKFRVSEYGKKGQISLEYCDLAEDNFREHLKSNDVKRVFEPWTLDIDKNTIFDYKKISSTEYRLSVKQKSVAKKTDVEAFNQRQITLAKEEEEAIPQVRQKKELKRQKAFEVERERQKTLERIEEEKWIETSKRIRTNMIFALAIALIFSFGIFGLRIFDLPVIVISSVIAMSIPLAILGYRIWQVCGSFIFICAGLTAYSLLSIHIIENNMNIPFQEGILSSVYIGILIASILIGPFTLCLKIGLIIGCQTLTSHMVITIAGIIGILLLFAINHPIWAIIVMILLPMQYLVNKGN